MSQSLEIRFSGAIVVLTTVERNSLEKAAKLIGKSPNEYWTSSEINDAFDHQQGSLAIDRVLRKLSDLMGYSHV